MISPKVHVIGTNGTYFKYKDVVYLASLDKDQMKRIYEVASKYDLILHYKGYNKLISNTPVEISHHYKRINPKLKEEDRIQIIESTTLDAALDAEKGDICKAVCFSKNNGVYDGIKNAKLELKQYNDFEVVSSHESNFEVMCAGTSKVEAIKELSSYLGIGPSETMSIGDNENDISMIEYAACGVAMGNGSHDAKAAADYVTDTNNNAGVAKAVLKFIIEENS
jgi:Cof subfamily protein (haloacid dehalogenase superfamily)